MNYGKVPRGAFRLSLNVVYKELTMKSPKKSSLVHACFSQNLNEQKPKKCHCRQRMSLSEATEEVSRGSAEWLILTSKTHTDRQICPICLNAETKKTCQNCAQTGEIDEIHLVNAYSSDIVLVSVGSLNASGTTTYRHALALKTPRVATIEKAHIERAYVYNNQEEQERIEAYGMDTLQTRIDMGITDEPEGDAKTWTGRIFDYGRSPYARISDERSNAKGYGSRLTRAAKIMNPYEEDADYD